MTSMLRYIVFGIRTKQEVTLKEYLDEFFPKPDIDDAIHSSVAEAESRTIKTRVIRCSDLSGKVLLSELFLTAS